MVPAWTPGAVSPGLWRPDPDLPPPGQLERFAALVLSGALALWVPPGVLVAPELLAPPGVLVPLG
ncbi:hypothetical protein ACWEGE_45775 [Amycolatopsis sp. NPDC004747]